MFTGTRDKYESRAIACSVTHPEVNRNADPGYGRGSPFFSSEKKNLNDGGYLRTQTRQKFCPILSFFFLMIKLVVSYVGRLGFYASGSVFFFLSPNPFFGLRTCFKLPK